MIVHWNLYATYVLYPVIDSISVLFPFMFLLSCLRFSLNNTQTNFSQILCFQRYSYVWRFSNSKCIFYFCILLDSYTFFIFSALPPYIYRLHYNNILYNFILNFIGFPKNFINYLILGIFIFYSYCVSSNVQCILYMI